MSTNERAVKADRVMGPDMPSTVVFVDAFAIKKKKQESKAALEKILSRARKTEW